MLKDMSDENLVPRLDLITAKKKLSEVEANQSAYAAEYVLTRSEEYSAALTELQQLQATLEVRKDQLERTSLYAPVRGIVNKVLITTIGGVVSPGDAILELTPLDDVLRVEARISPKDIAFVTPKMRLTVKLTAYDYTIYGSFPGEVVHISADTFEDETARERDPYYKVLIGVEASALEKNGKTIEISARYVGRSRTERRRQHRAAISVKAALQNQRSLPRALRFCLAEAGHVYGRSRPEPLTFRVGLPPIHPWIGDKSQGY